MTNEYTKKYTHELGEYPMADMSIGLLFGYAKNFYDKVDVEVTVGKDDSWLALGHYIVMIVESTHLLKKCHDERNYRPFNSYKELEQFLNRSKDTMDMHSYKLFRKKISFIKDRHP